MASAAIVSDIVGFLRSSLRGGAAELDSRSLDLAIVCGSGLSGLSGSLEGAVSIAYAAIPHFPIASVAGHGQELVFGRLGGKLVCCARGRFHGYEGYAAPVLGLLPRVFAALGARVLIVTNAAGGVNPSYAVGDLMVISDHLNLPGMTGLHPLTGANEEQFGPRFPPVTNAYAGALQAALAASAAALGLEGCLRRGGVYAMVSGPSYESRHEIGALRLLGADAVGMSTVPEGAWEGQEGGWSALCVGLKRRLLLRLHSPQPTPTPPPVVSAAHCGLSVLGISLITNRCVAPGDAATPPPSHEEVLAATQARARDLSALVAHFVGGLDAAAFPAPRALAAFRGCTSAPRPAPAACSPAPPHRHHASPGGLFAALRCPPIACAAGAAAGAAIVLALQALLKSSRHA